MTSRRFAEALCQDGSGRPALVAEYKKRSPWDGEIARVPIGKAIEAFERLGAAAISVLATPWWGASVDEVAEARGHTELPILAKGLFESAEQIAAVKDAGADAVLLVVGRNTGLAPACEKHGLEVVLDVHTRTELDHAIYLSDNSPIPPDSPVLVNARNLWTGELEPQTHYAMVGSVPRGTPVIAGSGLTVERRDALGGAGYDAVLVGTSLMRQLSRDGEERLDDSA